MVSQPIGEWLTLFALVFGPGVVVALLWSPFLLAGRLRALFRRSFPRESVIASYLLVMIGLSLPWVIGTGAALVRASPESLALANALLDVIVPLAALYVFGLPLLVGLGLPRAGIDWDPTGYGRSTWMLLGAGTIWYTALLAVPLLVTSFVLALPEHPPG